ncbi:MAG: hypothetical protein UU08_C0019G0001 [Candidatus Uhrbacteria bacterium GW2011_GWE2_40_58]|nr:MAG: hypothetical protein UT94_C0046G0009 [Candidatus Uhrbacteria bacterium GW2011_GWF2_40_263]KKR67345.1 MAG: hypothetical protein UU08_C0019G0001 [Candidatus Uhrbacteria bacterium GW2011_GWE2_40_58]OGL93545.1 MAG: hypothetical protein A2239_02360 [Candidatus Uhrbacteria bacterium RIFOXYA2_FULL_40_9]OGL96645.1 MAG: hypothetical protein A2332_01305 [Candidatus Uhrbacteria bacterium RIFOXYB2_FULL_41_18]HBK34723.1 hypothetical protein [Candidatus Uhrbacteria bacterium]
MFWIIFSFFLICSGLVFLGWLLWKKVPQLRVIDVEAIPEERERKVKERILLERFQRIQSSKFGGVERVARQTGKGLSKYGRRAVQKLYALEQYYQKLKKSSEAGSEKLGQEGVKRLLEEAEELIKQEEYIPAEKRYIEIISHHPKQIHAYEGLGNMYLKLKKYDQARETLEFAARLNGEDASVQMSLSELEMMQGNTKEALEHARRAVDIRSRNPRYLDFYLESALVAKEKEEAKKGLDLLKEVNPDNQKIAEFEERVKALEGENLL